MTAPTGTAGAPPRDARQLFVYSLQRIRGVCALAVIALHVTGPAHFTVRAPVDWFSVVLMFANGLARFAVPIFVLLSGFHLSLNQRNERPLPFYRRTWKRIAVPYVVYSTVYTAVQMTAWGSGNTLAELPGGERFVRLWLWNLLHASAQYHLWFIPAMAGLYLLHPFLRRWYRQCRHGGRLVALAFIIQLGCGLVEEASKQAAPRGHGAALAAVALACLPWLGYFVLGYFLHDHAAALLEAVRKPATSVAALVTWLTAGAILAAYWAVPTLAGRSFGTIPHPYLPHVLLGPPLSIAALTLMFLWLPRLRGMPPISRFVQACGLYAYGVYYLHLIVLELVGRGLTAGGLDDGHLGFVALRFLIGSVVCVYAVRQLARWPHTKYLV